MKRSLQSIIILFAVFAVVFGIRIFWFTQKDGFHVDEGMTLALTNYSDYITQKNYEYDREYSGREIKEISLIGGNSLKDALGDIKSLWKDNRDPPHTNLYYTILRISLIGINSADIKPIIFRGAILNLLIFTVSFIFLFLLIKHLFPDSVLVQYTAVLCAFLSTASISNTMFLRPYQIQEMMFIILCCLFIKIIDLENNLLNKKKYFLNEQIFLIALIVGITLLTGYYAVVFIGLMGLYVIIKKCKEKRFKDISFYILILVLGLIIAFVLYPKYFDGFKSYRGTETIKTLSVNTFENLKVSTLAAFSLLINHFFTIQTIAVCLFCTGYIIFYKQKLVIPKHALFIFMAAIVYIFVTLIIAPYKILRYGMPVYPFLAILPVILINSILGKSRKTAIIAAILLCVSFLPNAFNKNKIENLFIDKPAQYVFAQNAETPVYIFMYYFEEWNYIATWKYGNLVPYLNNEQKYYFIKDYEELNSSPYNEFYVIIENFPPIVEFNNENYEVIEEFNISTGEPETPSGLGYYYIGKKVRRVKTGEI